MLSHFPELMEGRRGRGARGEASRPAGRAQELLATPQGPVGESPLESAARRPRVLVTVPLSRGMEAGDLSISCKRCVWGWGGSTWGVGVWVGTTANWEPVGVTAVALTGSPPCTVTVPTGEAILGLVLLQPSPGGSGENSEDQASLGRMTCLLRLVLQAPLYLGFHVIKERQAVNLSVYEGRWSGGHN